VNDVATFALLCFGSLRFVSVPLVPEQVFYQVGQIVEGRLYQVNTKESILYNLCV
jgi:hypothetical protein